MTTMSGVLLTRCWRAGFLVTFLMLFPLPAAFGQNAVPAGGEVQLNTYTDDDQYRPVISRLSGGGMIAVWQSFGSYGTDDAFLSIQGRLFDAGGTAAGVEFQINTVIAWHQFAPAVAGLADGGFVAVWQSDFSNGSDTSSTSIQGRRYNAGGMPLGDQFQVNSNTYSSQLRPAVAALAGGGFVVVWHSFEAGDTAYSAQGQVYAADGRTLGGQLRVNAYNAGGQFDVVAAGLPGGGFVALWQSYGSPGSDNSSYSIQGQVFADDGRTLGPQFQVNTYTPETQGNPAVAALPDGGFVAVWQSWQGGVTDTSGYSIQGQRYAADGSMRGGEFQINSHTDDSQRNASVAAVAGGGFVTAWQSWGVDGSSDGIRAQRYAASGDRLGGEFGVNATTENGQSTPTVAALMDGGFMVAWQSFASSGGSDTHAWSVQGQRYADPRFAFSGLGGKCLDVEGGRRAEGAQTEHATDGTPVNLFRCHGGDNQRWRLELSAVPQRIVGLGGKCLLPGPVDGSGDTRVVIGTCGSAPDLWQLMTAGSSSPSFLMHAETGLCLDVEGAVVEDGTPTVLFECHGGANQVWRPAPVVCTPDSLGLCLNQERFRVDVEWRSFDGTRGSARAVPVGSDDSGLLWFFEADNWEMLIKVLDGCELNGRLWVFAAATTTVEYTLTVTDTELGVIAEYFNPLGNAAAAITDTGAFDTCPAGLAPPAPDEAALAVPQELPEPILDSASALRHPEGGQALPLKGSCVPSLTRMCLSQNRFSVEITWRDYAGISGSAQVVPMGSADSGLFWFFNSSNWEMLIKVLDACDVNGRFWMLAAATTDVEYTLRIEDTVTGVFREYFNPLGTAAPALVDTFQTCP